MTDDQMSDTDEDVSSVLLALPDGPLEAGDKMSYTTSHIGGHAAFPPVDGVPKSVDCKSCGQPMPLLSQVYAPLVDGENDRTVYVFACPRHACRRKDGSVRAYRASKRNEAYVADVAAKKAAAEAAAAAERERARKNPFTASAPSEQQGGLFGSNQPLFGAAAPNPFAAPAPAAEKPAAPAAEMAKLEIKEGEPVLLAPAPAYLPAQYLSTIDEYLPDPESDSDLTDDEDESPEQAAEWRDADGWDKILPKSVDDVFEKFVRRLETAEDASTQVLRYDFGAVPLAYQSTSSVFKTLFPGAPTKKPSSEEEDPDLSEYYTEKSIPKCPKCGAKRTFELQLVPQLINVLRPDSFAADGVTVAKKEAKNMTEEERKKELERIAKGDDANADGVADMEWGSVYVFGCEGDCVGVAEEHVLVDWEALAQ